MEKLLRVEEVAEILAVGKSTVYDLIDSGELPAVKFGRAKRVRPATLAAFVEGREAVDGAVTESVVA